MTRTASNAPKKRIDGVISSIFSQAPIEGISEIKMISNIGIIRIVFKRQRKVQTTGVKNLTIKGVRLLQPEFAEITIASTVIINIRENVPQKIGRKIVGLD